MSQNINVKKNKKANNGGKPMDKSKIATILISVLLAIPAVAFLVCYIVKPAISLLLGAIEIALMILTMNIAIKFNVNKHNSKTISIICIVFTVLSAILVFKWKFISYIFAIPALVLSYKAMKVDSKNRLPLILTAVSAIVIILGIILMIFA